MRDIPRASLGLLEVIRASALPPFSLTEVGSSLHTLLGQTGGEQGENRR